MDFNKLIDLIAPAAGELVGGGHHGSVLQGYQRQRQVMELERQRQQERDQRRAELGGRFSLEALQHLQQIADPVEFEQTRSAYRRVAAPLGGDPSALDAIQFNHTRETQQQVAKMDAALKAVEALGIDVNDPSMAHNSLSIPGMPEISVGDALRMARPQILAYSADDNGQGMQPIAPPKATPKIEGTTDEERRISAWLRDNKNVALSKATSAQWEEARKALGIGQPPPPRPVNETSLWVTRNGQPLRIKESAYQQGDIPYRAPTSADGGALSGNAANDQKNAEEVANAIADGTASPEILNSIRTTSQGLSVSAALHRKGVDANKLLREWGATKRAIASLNSNQQIRLSQAINKASESLDKLDELNQAWEQNGKRWGIKALNRASLKAAQNGVYGPEAASVAQRLEAQIADVTSELGQAVMGGNSPTDHALELASHNLSADWSQKVLADSIKQVRYNLNLAQNARNDMLEQLGVGSTQFRTPPPGAGSSPQVGERRRFGTQLGEWDGQGWKAVTP
jgi:hypothetical protein